MTNIHSDKLLILDFGSQYTQLIARRVRELGVYCELHPYDMSAEAIREFAPKGIILSGGHESVTQTTTPRAQAIVFDLGVPVLGICYGMQTMAAQLGGQVAQAEKREFGYAKVQLHGHSRLFEGIEDDTDATGAARLDVWMSHGDHVTQLPSGFNVIAKTGNAPIAAMGDDARHFYGVQFHPEVTHTRQGERILSRFIHDICGCGNQWTTANIAEELIAACSAQVGDDEVILGLSGGVDSSVAAVLLHRALANKLTCIFVDTGFLRLNEAEQVLTTFNKHLGIKVIYVDAAQEFLSALQGVADPEEKRKVFGRVFIEIFDKEAHKLNAKWLAQGTIYPDVIESAGTKTGKAQVIKSHHNVGGLPENMQLKLLEPLRELFKDEVRRLGLELGLPHEMVYRHPFPGPGLGIRVLGEINKELRQHDIYYKVSQAFAVFLPVKSVGVIGDARQYEPVIALRAVETIDFMTAHWARISYDILDHIASRIINEVPGISRVVYDISGKPPATIEWE